MIVSTVFVLLRHIHTAFTHVLRIWVCMRELLNHHGKIIIDLVPTELLP